MNIKTLLSYIPRAWQALKSSGTPAIYVMAGLTVIGLLNDRPFLGLLAAWLLAITCIKPQKAAAFRRWGTSVLLFTVLLLSLGVGIFWGASGFLSTLFIGLTLFLLAAFAIALNNSQFLELIKAKAFWPVIIMLGARMLFIVTIMQVPEGVRIPPIFNVIDTAIFAVLVFATFFAAWASFLRLGGEAIKMPDGDELEAKILSLFKKRSENNDKA